MNIGIYDTEHFETASTLIRILETQGHVIKLMGPPGLINEIRDERLSADISVLKPSPLNFITISKICKREKVEVLILNTVSYHHILIASLKNLLPGVKIILTVHDTVEFIKPAPSKNLKESIRALGKKALKKRADAYLVLLSSMKDELSKLKKPVYVLPGRLHKFPGLRSTSLLKLVIPGSVDHKRRDYTQVRPLLQLLKEAGLKINIEFLGAPCSKKDAAFIREIKLEQTPLLTITSYDSHIESRHYDHSLSEATILWAPLLKVFNGSEVYGKTKASGAFFDAVALGKPLLIPGYVNPSPEIKDLVIRYNTVEELYEFIKDSQEDNFDAIRQRVIWAASRFTPERYASSLKELLQDGS